MLGSGDGAFHCTASPCAVLERVRGRILSTENLQALYRAYGGTLYERCLRILRNPQAAEDATQEVFIRVQRHLSSLPPGDEALLWIYRIATNYCLNVLRDERRRPKPVSDIPERPGTHPEETLINRNLVEKLLGRMRPKLQAVAWLHYVDGLDQGEVARVLGISRRTVVSRLGEFNARAKVLATMGTPNPQARAS
jgi:RNA polymerase sigma-70 factor (ECF subfamily)